MFKRGVNEYKMCNGYGSPLPPALCRRFFCVNLHERIYPFMQSDMKKIILSIIVMVLSAALSVGAQEIPGWLESSVRAFFKASDAELQEDGYVYDEYRNCWHVSYTGNTAEGDIVIPSAGDYRVVIQNGAGGRRSGLQIVFFEEGLYKAISAFGLNKGSYFTESVVGDGKRCQFDVADYSVAVEYTPCKGVISPEGSSQKDYSYDRFVLTLAGDVPPVSKYLEDKAAEKAAGADSRRRVRMSGIY